jgi:TonB family protein
VETPGEDLNVRMEGIRRDYPEYYNNILRQMARCFRWRGEEDLRATVYFVIDRDGSVSQVDIRESSGSIAFDIEAMGAAECAGSRGRLGPLPETLPFDRFPVVFYFEPRTGR